MASVLHPTEKSQSASTEGTSEFDAETRERIEAAAEEKRRAREAPGLSWHDWLYYEAFKWWLVIALLIVDSWLVAEWFTLGSYVGLLLSLVGAIYAEFLLYRYLWYRPDPESPRRWRGEFHRTWVRPVEYGRWTPEAKRARRGLPVESEAGAIDPNEFL